VCNSVFVARELEAFGVPREKLNVIPNRLSRREPAVQPGGSPGSEVARDPHRIIYVGQIIPEKGIDLLLEAVALLARTRPAVTLDVVGQVDGWVSHSYRGYRERLMARASQPDLIGRVRFLGWRDDVEALYRTAAVHCCPSLPEQREGMPNVVLEAKRAATPSVVFATGPLPELVRHLEDGWVCDVITPDALAEGLAYFVDGPDARERAGRAAVASLQRFSADAFATRWWHVFTEGHTPPAPARESVAA
jgi:glycosyltransferase involved in cell wall biosynthesis